jgi:hypothetical protein
MASLNNVIIRVDIEPVVKLACYNFDCKFNLCHSQDDPAAFCNLKHIEIDDSGRCSNFERIEND